ncbi:hypothetical protein CSV65_14335 [Sporosarcina sp. P31]|nr:hypothetical protein CSV66_13895 [Sporosarcina sp. P30]PID07788.1 hypothetical protein CSV65_14335 [Sporosarcina sp. P31]PID11021.1 hypothetical protein CSV64_14130 [Sporosarcina sp. P32b]
MNFFIILLSLVISTILSVWILKKKNNKWLSMFSAFLINLLFLSVVTWVLYSMDEEAKIFGFGHSGLYVLIFAIPIVTWVNFLIFQFVKKPI